MGQIDLADKLRGTKARVDQQRLHADAAPVPNFQRLTRKEARVREDQYAALSALARRLMRARRARSERITENTLIRVAIDLLLIHKDALRGSNEEELRKSVTSALPNLVTHKVPEPGTSKVPDRGTSKVPDPGSAGGRASVTAQLRDRRTPNDVHLPQGEPS